MRFAGVGIFFMLLAAAPAWGAVQYSEGARDPFFENGPALVSDASAQSVAESWTLGGILLSPGHTQAWVNGKRVAVGDILGNARVTEIDQKGVRLQRDGKEGYLTRQGMRWS